MGGVLCRPDASHGHSARMNKAFAELNAAKHRSFVERRRAGCSAAQFAAGRKWLAISVSSQAIRKSPAQVMTAGRTILTRAQPLRSESVDPACFKYAVFTSADNGRLRSVAKPGFKTAVRITAGPGGSYVGVLHGGNRCANAEKRKAEFADLTVVTDPSRLQPYPEVRAAMKRNVLTRTKNKMSSNTTNITLSHGNGRRFHRMVQPAHSSLCYINARGPDNFQALEAG